MIKERLRKKILQKRLAQSREDIEGKSKRIKRRLFRIKEYCRARCVMFYLSFKKEVDTMSMIHDALRQGKKVFLPFLERGRIYCSPVRNTEEDLEKGKWGIMEPRRSRRKKVRPDRLDLVIVPGIGFDYKGNRLGFGRGCYDRFLQEMPSRIPRIGLAFDLQMVKELPHYPWDKKMDLIITEERIIRTKGV